MSQPLRRSNRHATTNADAAAAPSRVHSMKEAGKKGLKKLVLKLARGKPIPPVRENALFDAIHGVPALTVYLFH